jgi:hypothetical protein
MFEGVGIRVLEYIEDIVKTIKEWRQDIQKSKEAKRREYKERTELLKCFERLSPRELRILLGIIGASCLSSDFTAALQVKIDRSIGGNMPTINEDNLTNLVNQQLVATSGDWRVEGVLTKINLEPSPRVKKWIVDPKTRNKRID